MMVLTQRREYLAIIFWLLLFLNFPFLARYIDSASAPIDPGALSAIFMAVLALLLFKSITWWIIRAIWPVFAIYSVYHFEHNFKSLKPCSKVLIYLSFYLLVLFSFVLTLSALL